MVDVTKVYVYKRHGMWRWRCDICTPPAHGARKRWIDVMRISLPRHFKVRGYHHAWALKNPKRRA
jgi:hypothetical protein